MAASSSITLRDAKTNSYKVLRAKIESRRARVGVLGLGYVGLPLACALAEGGFATAGLEVDPAKVRALRSGRSYIPDVPSTSVRKLVEEGRFLATSRFETLRGLDVVIVCVPTPLRKTKDPDISMILAAAKAVQRHIRAGQLIILESTTYPGTTREILLPALSRPGLEAGRDFFLAFSPERIDPGNSRFRLHNTPKVVGGITARCAELARALYAKIVERVVPVSSAEAAEMTKLLENTFRAVNIGLVNELAMMCDRLGLDVWEVIGAASTKPFGYMPFYPGPGVGGHCIGIDPHYLAWKVKSLNFEPRFIELADAINSRMPEFVVEKAADLLNARAKRPLAGSKILALGVTYKKDAVDLRESPALTILGLLKRKGARVAYHDPFIPKLSLPGQALRSEPLGVRTLRSADLVIVLTDHSAVDYDLVANQARLVLDTRNALKGRPAPHVVRL